MGDRHQFGPACRPRGGHYVRRLLGQGTIFGHLLSTFGDASPHRSIQLGGDGHSDIYRMRRDVVALHRNRIRARDKLFGVLAHAVSTPGKVAGDQ
ncbi:Uncharacterised protein [Mycobacteroides abscessus subsp. abscessus]|nr:Uncharacterised protein [Mycobacteroides abscessus subsp. abscessus]